ncbi:MAG: 7-cyano-7-deazaguanine synthase, partial [Candidatus Diapherotrites archaeon]|nr:7-cyano-7-deazaguanine synthase [Candidatus Diapherotrites archaeon]
MASNFKNKGILLLSGGFDSVVAGWLAIQQGSELVALHFSLEPLTDNNPELKSRKLAEKIGIKEFHVVKIGKVLEEFVKNSNHKYYFVFMKRLMLRFAEILAEKVGAEFILTGENLGQVSSQTLSNLSTIDKVTKFPVLRPLLSFEKQEIIDLAKKIGTHDISLGPEMCDILG